MKYDQIVTLPVIEADRFVLRPVRRSDAGLLSMYAADKRVAWMTSSIPHPLPPGATEAFLERAMAEERPADIWIVDGARGGHGEVLGLVSLKAMDRSQSEISYWIAPAFWNTGLASEAVRAVIDANPHDARTLFAAVFQDNPASARVLTNAGFEYIGDAETFSVSRGSTVPTWTYILRLA